MPRLTNLKPRTADAQYGHLYNSQRWRGPHGIRQQALRRDRYTCQRCGCLLVEGQPRHPQAATINHKQAHKGKPDLFFCLANTEATCKACHDGVVQRIEARGHVAGSDIDGRPIDPNHPWNL